MSRTVLRTILQYVLDGHTPPPEDLRLALALVDTAVWPARVDALHPLRTAFERFTIAEVRRHGGIPHLTPEDIALREAVAELLARGWLDPKDFCSCGHQRETHHVEGRCHGWNCKCTAFVLLAQEGGP